MDKPRFLMPLLRGVGGLKRGLLVTGVISLVINLLQLGIPLFSMQIYDRVLPSGSRATLLALTLVVGGFVIAGVLLDGVRSQILIRLGNRLDGCLRQRLVAIALEPAPGRSVDQQASVRDLDVVRAFLAGPIAPAFLDLPWAMLFLLATFLLDPLLGVITAVGAVLVLVAALVGELRAARWTKAMQERMGEFNTEFDAALACRDSLRAMGGLGVTRERLVEVSWSALDDSSGAADRTAWSGAWARGLRSLLQVMLLVGATTLAIANAIPIGAIVASTMLFTRALTPIDRIASCWRTLLAVKAAATNLSALLVDARQTRRRLVLAPMTGKLGVFGLSHRAEGSPKYQLEQLTFNLDGGNVLVVVGASGSGKSTLARLLVGALRPNSGSIRIDGAALDDWDESEFGRQLGYLAQEQEYLTGTVAEVIARGGPVNDQHVMKAAGRVRAHEMIMRLPNAYQTQIGRHGVPLSAGQRRVISFARACYGDPAFLVLDDPTAYLGECGEQVAATAIRELRSLGSTVVVISSQTSLLRSADFVLWLEVGRKKLFAPAGEILHRSYGRTVDAPMMPALGAGA